MSSLDTRTRELLRSAQPPLRRFWPALVTGFGAAVSSIALLAASAWLIARAAEQPGLVFLSAVIVAVRAFALSRGAFRYLERLTGHDAALNRLADVRAGLVRRLVPLAPDGVGAGQGALQSNLVDDVEALQNLPLRVVQPLAVAGLASIGSVVFVAFLSPPAALALAACLTAAFALAIWVGWAVGARAERTLAPLRSRLAAALMDELTSLDVLLAYGATDAAARRIRDADTALRAATVRRATAQGLTAGAVSAMAGLASLLALVVAAPHLGTGGFTGPALAVVVLLPMAVFEVFGPLPLALASWREVGGAAERIAADVPDDVPAELPNDEPEATGIPPALGEGLVIRDLSARWPGMDAASALRRVDLRVRTGERLLVTGPSGAGKTTLAHMFVRFLDYSGSYTIGGVEARTLAGEDVRLAIGLCEQTPYLFDESIRQNLLFARDISSDDDLWAVLSRVGLDGWARDRGGLDARVGDRGGAVSGGQAQRIALARALLADFPVVVFDEPTAGVDAAASDALLTDLLSAAAGRTVVLVSHVEVPPGLVDRAVRLEDGRFASTG